MFWKCFLQNVLILAYDYLIMHFLAASFIMLIVKFNKKIALSLYVQLFSLLSFCYIPSSLWYRAWFKIITFVVGENY